MNQRVRLWLVGLACCGLLGWTTGLAHAQTGSGTTGSGTGSGTSTGSGLPTGSGVKGVPELSATGIGIPLCLIAGALLVVSERRRETA